MANYDHICPESQFLRDVSMHQMQIIRDDGVHRHIRFKSPASYCMHFDLITWPGYLCYTGDMGTYVFSRLEDMFKFFRTDREHLHLKDGQTLAINLGYWSEKLKAVDGNRRECGVTEFSPDKFRQRVKEAFEEECEEREVEAEQAQLWSEIEDRVLAYADDGEHEARMMLADFCSDDGFEFRDSWEWDLHDYRFHFVWCCYALAWGIAQYDAAREAAHAL